MTSVARLRLSESSIASRFKIFTKNSDRRNFRLLQQYRPQAAVEGCLLFRCWQGVSRRPANGPKLPRVPQSWRGFEFRGVEDGVSSAPDLTSRRATVKMSDPSAPSELEKRSTETAAVTPLKFSVLRLASAFVIAGVSDVIGAFASLAPPIGWAVDVVTAALLFVVLGWQWLLLPGPVLEAIPGVGVLPFWLLVVGAIAVLGTPRPTIGQH
jgi:hypothetical protein